MPDDLQVIPMHDHFGGNSLCGMTVVSKILSCYTHFGASTYSPANMGL